MKSKLLKRLVEDKMNENEMTSDDVIQKLASELDMTKVPASKYGAVGKAVNKDFVKAKVKELLNVKSDVAVESIYGLKMRGLAWGDTFIAVMNAPDAADPMFVVTRFNDDGEAKYTYFGKFDYSRIIKSVKSMPAINK